MLNQLEDDGTATLQLQDEGGNESNAVDDTGALKKNGDVHVICGNVSDKAAAIQR